MNTSIRRDYLDTLLKKYSPLFSGKVLDIGGKKDSAKGTFRPESTTATQWIYLNKDPDTQPDILCDLPTIPLDSSSIDCVICCETIEYIVDIVPLFEEINRILKPNGHLILSAPLLHLIHGDFEYDYHRFCESYLRNVLSRHFKIEKWHRMGKLPAVVFDLFRGYFSYSATPSFLQKALLKIAYLKKPLVKFLDQKLPFNNAHINTGYFIVARKNG